MLTVWWSLMKAHLAFWQHQVLRTFDLMNQQDTEISTSHCFYESEFQFEVSQCDLKILVTSEKKWRVPAIYKQRITLNRRNVMA